MERQDEIARLRAEVSALRREVRLRRRGRGWWRVPLALLCVAMLVAMPLGALASHFQDLNPGSVHNADIHAISDAGITRGCIDAQHYCPNDFVTREQMASFLARTAGLGGNPPVANALTAETAQSATNATNATNADNASNANTLGGWPANGLIRSAVGSNSDLIELDDFSEGNDITLDFETIATVTIDAPAPGYVLVSATLSLTADGSDAWVDVCLLDPVAGLRSSFLPAAIGTTPAATINGSISPVARFPVAAAGTRTYELRADKQRLSGTGFTIADNATIVALYVPFGADGTQGPGTGPTPGIFPLGVSQSDRSPRAG
jgi:hypothetical protein